MLYRTPKILSPRTYSTSEFTEVDERTKQNGKKQRELNVLNLSSDCRLVNGQPVMYSVSNTLQWKRPEGGGSMASVNIIALINKDYSL